VNWPLFLAAWAVIGFVGGVLIGKAIARGESLDRRIAPHVLSELDERTGCATSPPRGGRPVSGRRPPRPADPPASRATPPDPPAGSGKITSWCPCGALGVRTDPAGRIPLLVSLEHLDCGPIALVPCISDATRPPTGWISPSRDRWPA
jgi:hypothetical protein